MPPVTLAAIVDLTKVKMKWKETYVSEGLNRKVIPAAPRGIYSGLRLVQNITASRQVEVSSSPDGTHAAVHQSATGFSTTYQDNAGVSTILNLSDAALTNQEAVITLSITYVVGADTTANWIAYPIADWNALTDAQRAEKIVLGTVNVPAAATNIITSMITTSRRSAAWESTAPGAVAWSPVVKNSGFEHASQFATNRYAISDWEISSATFVNATLKTGTATVRTGAQSLEFEKTNAAAGVAVVTQHLEIPVVSGQSIRIVAWVKQVMAITAGSYFLDLQWGDSGSNAAGSTSINTAAAVGAVDVSFRKIDQIVQVPSTGILKWLAFRAAGVTAGTLGVAFVVDDLQVYVERSVLDREGAQSNHLAQQMVSSLVVADTSLFTTTPPKLATLVRFDRTLPTVAEGTLVIERKDQNYAGSNLPPAIDQTGRLFLGSRLVDTEDKALMPRITANQSTAAGVEFTLMWESKAPGGPGYRKYIQDSGFLIETYNAVWSGTSWSKDVAGTLASKVTSSAATIAVYTQSADPPWLDSTWASQPFLLNTIVNLTLAIPLITNGSLVVNGGLVVPARNYPIDAAGFRQTAGVVGFNFGLTPRRIDMTSGDRVEADVYIPENERVTNIFVSFNQPGEASSAVFLECYLWRVTLHGGARVLVVYKGFNNTVGVGDFTFDLGVLPDAGSLPFTAGSGQSYHMEVSLPSGASTWRFYGARITTNRLT